MSGVTPTLHPSPATFKPNPSPLDRGLTHDMPPRWDGHIVDWDNWRTEPVVFICPPAKPADLACRSCGSLDPRQKCIGALAKSAVVTRDQIDGYTAGHHPGRVVTRELHATRCQCGRTQVYDLREDRLWDLDDSDYNANGSYDSAKSQGELW